MISHQYALKQYISSLTGTFTGKICTYVIPGHAQRLRLEIVPILASSDGIRVLTYFSPRHYKPVRYSAVEEVIPYWRQIELSEPITREEYSVGAKGVSTPHFIRTFKRVV